MKVSTIITAIAMLFVLSCTTVAQETGRISEAFACNFKDGKGSKDLWAAVDFWNEQMDAMGAGPLDDYFAAILTPYRATTGADFFWLGSSSNLNSFATGGHAYVNSPQGQAADARFEEISRCDSNVFLSETLYDGLGAPDDVDPSAFLETFACTLNEDATMDDVTAAEEGWIAHAKSAGAKVDVIRWTPLYANTSADVYYLVVSADMPSFGAYRTAWLTSEGGQAADRAFDEITNCESGLMIGTRIRVPAPPQ
jgi:hypothetical protein